MSVSKLSASFLSATNENSVSLASLKLDFSLVKVEAPAEYTSLGPALSAKRKEDAEEGPVHRTARRLGILFEQLIPSTPKLLTAFGLRCTEIMKTPGVNPQGNVLKHGPFSAYVGADGTALWAAATSGIASLGVYLLACLLADSWDSTQATSIWVELVHARKKEILTAAESNRLVSEASFFAAKQDITREDLKVWDNSARAWLASANQAKHKEKTQFGLIIKNLNVPFNAKSALYEEVVEVWQQSMKGMEEILQGRPQKITNKASLLAFPAWSIYPDLLVLVNETVSVPFNDPLVPNSGVCTLGTWERYEEKSEIMSWSLALSHLQYYGTSVTVHAEGSNIRVTPQQFQLVVLGAVFGAWKLRTALIYEAAEWVLRLHRFLTKSINGKLLRGIPWLAILGDASNLLISDKEDAGKKAQKLVQFGHRRCDGIFPNSSYYSPFFGLKDPLVLKILSESSRYEASLHLLRKQLSTRGSKYEEDFSQKNDWRENCLIASTRWQELTYNDRIWKHTFYEFATSTPHNIWSRKRDEGGNLKRSSVHARWLFAIRDDYEEQFFDESVTPLIKSWKAGIEARGELAFSCEVPRLKRPVDTIEYFSLRPANLFTGMWRCPAIDDDVHCNCLSFTHENDLEGPPQFDQVVYSWPCQAYIRRPFSGSRNSLNPFTTRTSRIWKFHLDATLERAYNEETAPTFMSQHSSNHSLAEATYPDTAFQANPNLVYDYLCCISDPDGGSDAKNHPPEPETYRKYDYNFYSYTQRHIFPVVSARSLYSLAVISEIYGHLNEATISLDVIKQPLSGKQLFQRQLTSSRFPRIVTLDWGTISLLGDSPFIYTSELEDIKDHRLIFGCIARFESGCIDLDIKGLSSVFAVASGNAIYVPEEYLVDPYQSFASHGTKIKRIIGNVGKSGISMLVTPQKPLVREVGNEWSLIEHAPYNWKRENNFKGTSMHLSLTQWSAPVEAPNSRSIDWPIQFTEAVISVVDAGKWVADLNIAGINKNLVKCASMKDSECSHSSGQEAPDYTSIDNWEELLDRPNTVGIIRAKDNWTARLAALSIAHQTDPELEILLCPTNYCLACAEESYSKSMNAEKRDNRKPYESNLPQICID